MSIASEKLPSLMESSHPFLGYLANWYAGLPDKTWDDLLKEAGSAQNVAVLSVDVIRGFCSEGRLSSPRVGAIVRPIADLFAEAYGRGVRQFVLLQDAHPADSKEFRDYGPHAQEGSREAETMPELARLPFSSEFEIITKKSVQPAAGTRLDEWLDNRPDLRRIIVVGDCTDICVYLLAVHLRTRAVAGGLDYEVIVPENCVETYDLPVQAAESIGALPHDADLLHLIFLYHMSLNGVHVVRRMAP